MFKKMLKKTDKQLQKEWLEFADNISKSSPIDLNETPTAKKSRLERLEKNPEAWKKYYFPNFYSSEPATFHIEASKRLLKNAEWFEVWAWSRELAKSVSCMMNVLHLTLTGKKKNVILTSNSYDNAERLLLPYKIILEKNNRIINDYGTQQSIGNWEVGEFITQKGVAFRALGAGQSPRGTRNNEVRPDVIIIDDFDTDEECRNPTIIKNKVKWLEEALLGTRSISNPLLVLVCGNIIAKFCCVTELMKKADHVSIINIRDKEGQSTWPQKNSEAQIDRVLSKISHAAQQKEYFNNPMTEGEIFKEITWGKCPPMKSCDKIIVYADPSPSNRSVGNASHKCVVIVGRYRSKFYVYKVWLDVAKTATFIDWLFAAYQELVKNGVDVKRIFIENNSLQDAFYTQVLLPQIKAKQESEGVNLPISEDKRNKKDKFDRIEGTLEPIHSKGELIFNEKEKANPHMERMETQLLGVSATTKTMDGPDALEGAIWLIQNKKTGEKFDYFASEKPKRGY